MTFRFTKIGPVDHADITLGDLTIIAGRNNTGKTYLVYALYGFLKQWWEDWPRPDELAKGDFGDFVTDLKLSRIVKALGRSERVSIPISRSELDPLRLELVHRFASDFSTATLPAVFNSAPDIFEDAHMSIDLGKGDPSNGYLAKIKVVNPSFGTIGLKYNGHEIVLSVDRESTVPHRRPPLVSLRDVLLYLLFQFVRPHFPRPFILSAERFGISLFYKELDFTKSQLVDMLQKMGSDGDRDSRSPFLLIDKTTSRYAQPIKDNIDYTRSIYDIQKERSPLANDKLFDDIKDLMEGYYKASKDAISFRAKTRGKRRFDIPLHLASSSARGLADLYFYLRHKAAKDDLLIIDEPESHLDTGNQVLLARILARFVRAGIKVLITTHSDYVIKEINNLIMLSQLGDDNVDTLRSLNYSESDQLDPSSVRAYVAQGHRLTPAVVDEFGIDMPVFDDTIDKINRVSRKLAAEVESLHAQE